MTDVLTFDIYADYVEIDAADMDTYRRLYKSYTNDVTKADLIWQTANLSFSEKLIDDRSLLPEHTYYYWVTDYSKVIQTGPYQTKLFQPKITGSKGGKRRTLDYDVECPLCGFACRRNKLRRGYVKPHTTGSNYLANAAAPETWTWTNGPLYWDANVYNWFSLVETDPAFYYPQIMKKVDVFYPGVVVLQDTDCLAVVGTPSTASTTGSVITWVYPITPCTGAFKLWDGASTDYLTVDLASLQPGWHKVYQTLGWPASSLTLTEVTASGTFVLGGFLLTEEDPAIAILPDRTTGAGVYTVGGMMDLCPDCYSGLRRRVPWE